MTLSHSSGRRAPDSETFAPARLLEEGSERERRLLGSARFDGVPGEARDRFAQALSIPKAARPIDGEAADARVSAAGQAALDLKPAAGIATGGAPNVAVSGAARLGKHGTMLLGVLGVVGAIVASRWAGPAAPVDDVPVAPVITAAQANLASEERSLAEPSAGNMASSRTELTSEQPPLSADGELASGGVVTLPKPGRATRKRSRAAGSKALAASVSEKAPIAEPTGPSEPAALGSGSRGLLEEVRWLEEVSELLKADQTERAARALTRYERRYPEGELAIEAALLRVELALAQGERQLGLKLARELMARPAASRYLARLSRLLGEPTRSNGAAPEITGSNVDAAHMRGRR
jgi:hypothetical protein